jgi:hypothetical protein
MEHLLIGKGTIHTLIRWRASGRLVDHSFRSIVNLWNRPIPSILTPNPCISISYIVKASLEKKKIPTPNHSTSSSLNNACCASALSLYLVLVIKASTSVLPQLSMAIQSTLPSTASTPAIWPRVPSRCASLTTEKRIMRGSSLSERHMAACVAADASKRIRK